MKKILFILSALLLVSSALAQTETGRVTIILKGNRSFEGIVVSQDSALVVFKTSDGMRMEIPRSSIQEIIKHESGRNFPYLDPNSTRLFFAPTARALEHLDGYIADYWVFFPMAGFGLFNHLTLAGGMTLFPGANEQMLYLAPKVTVLQKENFALGGGLLYMNLTSFSKEGVGIFYGVATVGDRDRAITLGAGWAYAGSDVAKKPVLLLGGEYRVAETVKLISENWIIPDSEINALSFGIRLFGRKLATDLALMYPLGSDMGGGFPFFPWLSFAYNF